MPTSNHSKQILIGNLKTQSRVLCTSLFCSQVFKTTSNHNVLNSDVNIVNTDLIAFCSLAVTKLAPCWPVGGTLGISGWGCAAGTLEPFAYTKASSAEFCYPILE